MRQKRQMISRYLHSTKVVTSIDRIVICDSFQNLAQQAELGVIQKVRTYAGGSVRK